MRVLILGGTVFLGRHLVAAARAAGHEVTLFNRGTHGDVVPDVEQIHGDRHGDLSALDRSWDAAIDTNAYLPWSVERVAGALRDRVPHYTLVSSISAVADYSRADYDEAAPLHVLEDEAAARVRAAGPESPEARELYGELKAACERAAEFALPGRALIVRPGLIVGPHDPTDRFTWWVRRAARGGDTLAPGRPGRGVQMIDVRDLAAWMVRMVEARTVGVFQATGPDRPLAMGSVLEACAAVSASAVHWTWVDEGFLLDAGVQPWIEMPLWIPEGGDPRVRFLMAADVSRARRVGLVFRPLADTVRDTLEWDRARGEPPMRAGLDPARERDLLVRWRHEAALRSAARA
jgi:2'-hydroxyisoflavone reductase